MASRREIQQEDARFRIMRLLSEDPDISTRQIARKVGISNGSVHYVLSALVEKGFLKIENFRKSPRKGQYSYLLTPKGIGEKAVLTQRFIDRKRKEFGDLKSEIESLEREINLEDKDSTSDVNQGRTPNAN